MHVSNCEIVNREYANRKLNEHHTKQDFWCKCALLLLWVVWNVITYESCILQIQYYVAERMANLLFCNKILAFCWHKFVFILCLLNVWRVQFIACTSCISKHDLMLYCVNMQAKLQVECFEAFLNKKLQGLKIQLKILNFFLLNLQRWTNSFNLLTY